MISNINESSKKWVRRNCSPGLNIFLNCCLWALRRLCRLKAGIGALCPFTCHSWVWNHLEIPLPACMSERVFTAGGMRVLPLLRQGPWLQVLMWNSPAQSKRNHFWLQTFAVLKLVPPGGCCQRRGAFLGFDPLTCCVNLDQLLPPSALPRAVSKQKHACYKFPVPLWQCKYWVFHFPSLDFVSFHLFKFLPFFPRECLCSQIKNRSSFSFLWRLIY